jgi:dephospho-CoA kinase
MIIIGLTGVIGSGKSTVAGLLRKRGLPVIDFDVLAKESLTWEETRNDIRDAFGAEFVQGDQVDVARLQQTVFGADHDLRKLEEIIHPRVSEKVEHRLVALEREGVKAAVIDHPLLFEAGFHRPVDMVVVVSARMDIIRERLKKRGMKSEDIERRISFQIPIEEKEKKADCVIDNNGAENRLEGQVDSLVQKITKWEVLGNASK